MESQPLRARAASVPLGRLFAGAVLEVVAQNAGVARLAVLGAPERVVPVGADREQAVDDAHDSHDAPAPCRASTLHAVATGGPAWSHVSSSATERWGGCHSVGVALDALPPPKSSVIAPPTRPSTRVGTHQDELSPGPVAMASHTGSGAPTTSTPTRTLRRPDGPCSTLPGRPP